MNTTKHQPTMKTISMNRKTLITALAGVFLLSGLGLLASRPSNAQSTNEGKAAATGKASMTITTTKPLQGSLPLRLSANGNVAAWQEASVGSESSGLRLSEVRVNVGDFVQRDQVLAVFDSETVAADVTQAKAALAEAQASSAEAISNAERARTLQTTGALSTQQINQFLTAELTAKARVDSARASLLQQELRLKHTRVLANDGGVISARSATVGAVVGASTELFRLIRQGRLEWRAEVTSAELSRVKVGSKVQIIAPSGNRLEGKVRMVGPTVDVQTRNALVYVDITPGNGTAAAALKAGMYARGEFEIGSSGALTVPQEAVVMRDGFSYVFKVGTDNKVVQQKVETGRRIGNQVEITRGLIEGTLVAQTGAGFLNDGDTVRINNPAQ
jgi:RND family efflux transporter MFP subunit